MSAPPVVVPRAWQRVEATGFVGRKTELAQLGVLLDEGSRLVTVTGPGGVGKTRLVLRAAANAVGKFPDGICLTELSGLGDPVLLAQTVATSLGLPEQDARSQLSSVIDFLRDRSMLLILDTCEHLLDACAMLAETVLAETSAVTILATSRQALDVSGEHAYLVPPLPVTGTDGGDAAELFAQRAAAAVAGFTVRPADLPDVIALCRRLDGIPLAIELAAVRLRALPLHSLAERLEDRFQVLTGSRRTRVPRHQTLLTAIEWSHELCSPAEQALWSRLSVFAGGFTVAATEDVCADASLERADILPTLIGLVDKSIVLRADDGDVTRFRLLDTLREFGAERLAETGLGPEVRGRHVERYLRQARQFDDQLLDGDQIAKFHELRREHDNIRAALKYGLELPEHGADAAMLASALYWPISGFLREGRYWLTKIIGQIPDRSEEHAWALIARGYMGGFQGEAADAVADTYEGTELAERLGAERTCARGWLYKNFALTFGGRLEEAIPAGAEAERRLDQVGDYGGWLQLAAQMGHLHQLRGEVDLAIDWCTRGLDGLSDYPGEQWIQSYLHLVIGFALYQVPGSEAECAAAVSRALRSKHALGDRVGTAFALETLGWLAADAGRYVRTAWLLGASDSLWERVGSRVSNQASMEECHQRAVKTAAEGIGDQRYDAWRVRGASCSLDEIVSLAAADADVLPGPDPTTSRATADLLTRRETEIAELIGQGLSNREIAAKLVISKRTVDAHVEHIYAKLGISSRAQLATWLVTEKP
jgi:predicted ATPase/DNA-binding NarL/FixJ family response regulator